jgi:hypothetical protein
VFHEIIPDTANSNVSETRIPVVTGIAIVANIAIAPMATVPTTIELIIPNNPKYHVNMNAIRTIIVAKIQKMICKSIESSAGFAHVVDKISKSYPCVEKLILAATWFASDWFRSLPILNLFS